MNTFSAKISAVAAALLINGLVMGALGYLFEIQSHPHMSVVAFAKAVVAHQWLI
ncbi:MAG: hypothetical protein QOD95_418 [Gammaproteobacteria bacterium]|jgi:hypothetical protein|nr:hypothetical protein [Gammaproteobacteria bacterium]